MRGVSVFADDLDVANAQMGFDVLFSPILPRLSELHWVFDEWPLWTDGLGDELCTLSIEDLSLSMNYVPPGTLFPFCTKYIKNDWLNLYGFNSMPDPKQFLADLCRAESADGQKFHDLQKKCRTYEAGIAAYQELLRQRGSEQNRFLDETTEICIFNIDGGQWELFCRDETLLQGLLDRFATIPGLKISSRDLISRLD